MQTNQTSSQETTRDFEPGYMRYFREKEAREKKNLYLRLLVLTLLINLIFLATTFGQNLTVKNVTITNGATITVKGDVKTEGGATINNSGTIELSGKWENNSGPACLNALQGTVVFNGNTQQTIEGPFTTAFNNLTLAGTSGAKLSNVSDIYIGSNGTLSLGDAPLDLGSGKLNIINAAPGAITTNNGYILSEKTDNSAQVKWNIGTNAGAHIVPFGNANGDQLPLSFTIQSGNAGEVTFSTYPTAADNNPLPVTPVAVSHVRDISGNDNSADVVDRFWQIDASGNPVASLSFTYANSENAANGNSNMRAQRWNPLIDGWDAAAAGQINLTTQSTTVNNVSAFGAWTLSQQSSPLPIKLLFFDAKAVSRNEVKCTWATATEKDNDFYTIERSKDGYNYEEAGRVKGSGTSHTMLNYLFTDTDPYAGVSYYRLKQTDYNGDFSHSKPVAVRINEDGIAMQVYPNPAMDFIQVASNDESVMYLKLTDPSGKLIQEIRHEQFTKIDISTLAPGIYFLVSHSEDGNVNNTFRVKKL